MKSILVYGRFHTTSYIFIHVLKSLFQDHPQETANLHIHLILDDRRDLQIARGLLPEEHVTVHAQYAALNPLQRDRTWPEETIRQWEERYGSPHLRSYLLMERALQGKSEQVKWRYLFSHLEYFEKICRQIQPILYVTGAADGLLPWTAMTVMKANDIPLLSFSPARFERRSFILDNPYELLHVGPLYQQFRSQGIPEDLKREAERLLQQYQNKLIKPLDHLSVQKRQRSRKNPLPNPLLAWKLIWEAASTDAGKYFELPLAATFQRAIAGKRTSLYHLWLSGKQIRQLPPGEQFFFLPLQYEPEISLATQGRGWTNQLNIIRAVNDALPIDRWLYVKEHPSMLAGLRSVEFYRTIISLPRVRLLQQSMNSYSIVPRAEAILTITGTAGWEGLMFGRPVVLFGHSFYEEFEEGVIRVNQPQDLPSILRNVRDRQIPQEALLAYMAAVLSKTRRGFLIEPRVYSDQTTMILSRENLEDIAQVILEHLAPFQNPVSRGAEKSVR